MKHKIIKIGIPLWVLIGILAIIVATQKPIEELSSELRIEPFNFKNYVEQYITDSIVGKPLTISQKGYDKIYDIITTESSIISTTSNGTNQLLDPQDAEECYVNSFKAYFSVFGANAFQLFSNSIWNDQDLNNLKQESQRLLSLQGTISASDSLNNYISYVNGYYAAIRLLSQSRYCSNTDSYKSYCNKAKQYSCYPYVNNAKLNNIVQDVSNNAKTGWQNSIEICVVNICNRPANYYYSYDEFYNGDYLFAYNKIKDYNSTFNTSWGSDLKKKLNDKDIEIKGIFLPAPSSQN